MAKRSVQLNPNGVLGTKSFCESVKSGTFATRNWSPLKLPLRPAVSKWSQGPFAAPQS